MRGTHTHAPFRRLSDGCVRMKWKWNFIARALRAFDWIKFICNCRHTAREMPDENEFQTVSRMAQRLPDYTDLPYRWRLNDKQSNSRNPIRAPSPFKMRSTAAEPGEPLSQRRKSVTLFHPFSLANWSGGGWMAFRRAVKRNKYSAMDVNNYLIMSLFSPFPPLSVCESPALGECAYAII